MMTKFPKVAMTRYSDDSDFIDPRALSRGDGYSDYSNSSAQFADYRMPGAGRIPSSQTVGYRDSFDGGNLVNNMIDGVAYGALRGSIRNQQLALSMEMNDGYSNYGNYSRPTWDGGMAWNGNGRGGHHYRDSQMRHAYEQEMQQELYYRNTIPRYRYPDYDQDPGWNLPSRRPIYRDPGFARGYDDDYPMEPNYNLRRVPNSGRDYQRNFEPGFQIYDDVMNGRQSRQYRPIEEDDRRVVVEQGNDYWDDVPVRGRQRQDDRDCPPQRFDESDQRANSGTYDQAVYNHLLEQAKALSGHNIQEFDKSVPIRLGCARAVSLLVNKGYGFDVKDQSIANLEQTLRKKGFTQVDIKDMQPGDVICGYREAGDYPHGAVYMGNGQIFNNDSDDGIMEIQSIAKYNKSEFKRFVVLHRPDSVPAVARNQYSENTRTGSVASSDSGSDTSYNEDSDSNYSTTTAAAGSDEYWDNRKS